MKWFQHKTDSHTNLKHREILADFGLEAYAVYWICLELIGQQGTNYRLNSSKSWIKALKDITKLPNEKLDKILKRYGELNLICRKSLEKGELYVPKMREYSDYSTQRVRREYVQSAARLDKNTLDKIIQEYITQQEWVEQVKDPEVLKSVFIRNVKPAKQLYLLIKDLDLTLRAMRWTAASCKNKGLSWTIETVIKWYPEFLKHKAPEPDRTPTAVKELMSTIGNMPKTKAKDTQCQQ